MTATHNGGSYRAQLPMGAVLLGKITTNPQNTRKNSGPPRKNGWRYLDFSWFWVWYLGLLRTIGTLQDHMNSVQMYSCTHTHTGFHFTKFHKFHKNRPLLLQPILSLNTKSIKKLYALSYALYALYALSYICKCLCSNTACT